MTRQSGARQEVFKAVVHAEKNGGYWAEVIDLPGCYTQGDTLDEVYHNLIEAISCHLGPGTFAAEA